jgi:uncharacterized SAM-binding protein YcdF (DUF218 family)
LEPKEKKSGSQALVKSIFFIAVLLYVLIAYYHIPVLTFLGRYLVVEHTPSKSDVIVCLSGGHIERGMETADVFLDGLGSLVFIARERPPDGHRVLRARGITYPDTTDLLVDLLERLGVPEEAVLRSNRVARSTLHEAEIVRDLMNKKGYGSAIVVTSPTHARRAWMTFQRVFDGQDIRLQMVPSKYSTFKPDGWWKDRKHVKDVIIEYQKLVFYAVRYAF